MTPIASLSRRNCNRKAIQSRWRPKSTKTDFRLFRNRGRRWLL